MIDINLSTLSILIFRQTSEGLYPDVVIDLLFQNSRKTGDTPWVASMGSIFESQVVPVRGFCGWWSWSMTTAHVIRRRAVPISDWAASGCPAGRGEGACRRIATQGKGSIDPVVERRRIKVLQARRVEQAKTFAGCEKAYIVSHRATWKNAKHGKQCALTLEPCAYPKIGRCPVADIDTTAILGILEPIWSTKTETVSRVRGRIESVLDWAAVRGYRQGKNPARLKGHLDKLLSARSKVRRVEHHPALPYADMAGFMAELAGRAGIAARALEFGILTAARSGEVRGARWEEFDLNARTWTIPADRMKAGKEHRVQLTTRAVTLLQSLPRVAGSAVVFTAPRGGKLSNMTLTAVLRRMGRKDVTQHGFRSAFRDWAGETTAFPREVIEHALAHQLRDKVEAVYQRGDLLQKRVELMQAWADYCDSGHREGVS